MIALGTFAALIGVAAVDPSAASAATCGATSNYFDGNQNTEYGYANHSLQGTRATIGEFAQGNPATCTGTPNPYVSSSAWTMSVDSSCQYGFLQAGYSRANIYAPDTTSTWYFTEFAACSSFLPPDYYNYQGIANAQECYIVSHSGTDHSLTASVWTSPTCTVGGSGTKILGSIAYTDTLFHINTSVYSGETWSHAASGANTGNSDSVAGYSTNHALIAKMSYRDLSGAWHYVSTYSLLSPSPPCGLHQHSESSTSFSIWPDFTGC